MKDSQKQHFSQISSTNDGRILRDRIFTATWEQWFFHWYKKFFSIVEIENSKVLQWFFGATLFSYFIIFQNLITRQILTIDAVVNNTYQCWPYFQNCSGLYFLRTLPEGYSQPILYMVLFGVIILSVYLAWKKDWVLAHLSMLVLFSWQFFVMFVMSKSAVANYDYYLTVFAIIYLFLPFKLFFLKLAFVVLYFLATTIKIDDGWILGTYFSALKTGLPIFPDAIIPFITNLVIFMQMIGAWFLLSSNKFLQRTALFYFVTFHLYSGILVYFRYPSMVLPSLLILFGPMYSVTSVPLQKKTIIGWAFIGLLFIFQFLSIIIPGDERLTGEGNKYGLYMFEANHQCISTATIYSIDGSSEKSVRESNIARNRCDPYRRWFNLKQLCNRYTELDYIEWLSSVAPPS